MKKQDVFDLMREKWPAPVVAAAEVKAMTGGIVTGKTFANMRSKGDHVPDSIIVGNRRVYIVSSVIDWLRNRTQVSGDQT